MNQTQQDFYQNLRGHVRQWADSEKGRKHRFADLLLLAPDLFHLLCKLSLDPEVPLRHKTKLVMVIAYLVSPIDLIPEAFLGPVGYVDDIALAAWGLNKLVNETSSELVRRHWAGEEDVLDVLGRVIAAADRMVGGGLWKRLKGMIG